MALSRLGCHGFLLLLIRSVIGSFQTFGSVSYCLVVSLRWSRARLRCGGIWGTNAAFRVVPPVKSRLHVASQAIAQDIGVASRSAYRKGFGGSGPRITDFVCLRANMLGKMITSL